MKYFKNNVLMQEMDKNEMQEINGGIDPVSVITLALALVAFGYQMGKDRVEADRR
jgi:lactobin A/cerein 7B family class IIb bacteriocin